MLIHPVLFKLFYMDEYSLDILTRHMYKGVVDKIHGLIAYKLIISVLSTKCILIT